jgi:hypothetical protein
VGDVDGDGAPDLLVTRIDEACALGMNRMNPGARRLYLRCLGSNEPGPTGLKTPADGMGTRVVLHRLAKDERPSMAAVQTSRGFQSASSPWLHFGLGSDAGFAGLTVFWPSGRREELPGGASNRRLWIREGQGVVREEAF